MNDETENVSMQDDGVDLWEEETLKASKWWLKYIHHPDAESEDAA